MEGSEDQMVSNVLRLANNSDNLDDFYGKVFTEINKIFECQSGFILVEENSYLSMGIAKGASPAIWRSSSFKIGKGVIGKLAEASSARILNNPQELEIGQYFDKSSKSALVSPLMHRGNLLGLIGLFKKEKDGFSEDDSQRLTELGSIIGMIGFSYKNSQLFTENRKIKNELRVIEDMLKKLSHSLDHPQMIFDLLQAAAQITNSQRAALAIHKKNDNSLEIHPVAFNLNEQEAKSLKVNHDEKLGGAAFCRGTVQVLNQMDEEHTDHFKKARLPIKSMMAVPLKMKSQTTGVLYLLSENEGNYRELDQVLLDKIASLIASALSHLQISQVHQNILARERAIVESINIGICVLNKDGKILSFNRAAENLTGYHADEIMGKGFNSVFGISDLHNSGKTVELQKKNGQVLKSSLSVVNLANTESEQIGLVISLQDIEGEILFKEAQKSFSNITTSQLKVPATGLKTLIEMVLAGTTGEITQKTRNVLEEAKVTAEKLRNIMENIFYASQIEKNNIGIRIKKVNLAQIADEVISNYRSEAEERGIGLSSKINNPFYIKADVAKTRQILNNLINNSINYTKKGNIIVSAKKHNHSAEIGVTDTGIGMTEMQVKNLFSKYYRIKSPETSNIHGAGLGLWAAKKLVEAQNGKISVVSKKGLGSTLKISLPASS